MSVSDLISVDENSARSEDSESGFDDRNPKGVEGENDASEVPNEHLLRCKLTNIEYIEQSNQPVVQLFGRDENGNQWQVNVTGHRPHCYVPADEVRDNFENHYTVNEIYYQDDDGDPFESIHGKRLAKIETYLPKHVSEVRELFSQSWEADVFYYNRFLIDTGIETGFAIDLREATSTSFGVRTDVEHVYAVDPPQVDSRLGVIDIEVASEDGFPDVEDADAPVSTIVAYDSYSEEYIGWVYHNTEKCEWESGTVESLEQDDSILDDTRVFEDETELLSDFNYYIADKQFDLLSGWFSSDFDYPYLINRCRNLNVWSFQEWSPVGNVYVSSRWNDPVVDGVTMFDMLEGYQKTQVHKLKSKTLDYVAQKELGYGKEDFQVNVPDSADNEYTWAWKHDIETFLEYNHRDVEAVVEIEQSQQIIDMFDHIRDVSGATYDDCSANINLIDVLTLRHAKDAGVCLPTSTPPQEDWFYGAHVFDPRAGLHENVIYLDYSSLYPNQLSQLNLSPETIIGPKEDLEESPYTEDDCVWSYIDTRPVEHKKDSDPQYERCYILKPSVREGFFGGMVDDLIDMKDEYRGTDKYEAVKRVVNSCWGVAGDSKSFGVGFRLFNWMMAECITLGGRKVILDGSDYITDYCDKHVSDNYIVMGDTDGFGLCIEDTESMDETLDAGYELETELNNKLPEISHENFNIEERNNRMEIECESYAPRVFVPAKNPDQDDDKGVRKRYAQTIGWEQ